MAQLTPEDRARLDAFKAVTVKHAHLTRVDDSDRHDRQLRLDGERRGEKRARHCADKGAPVHH